VPAQSAEVVHATVMSFEQRSPSPWPASQRRQSSSTVHAVAMSFEQRIPSTIPYTSTRFENAA
jgi:hypothetical protein